VTGPARRVGIACVCLGAVLAGGGVAVALRGSARPAPPPSVPLVDVGQVPAGANPALHRPASAAARAAVAEAVPRGTRLVVHGVAAPVGQVRVVAGELQVPRDPRRVGWWRGSAVPGERSGTAVIAGHVNYAGVTGALAVLPQVQPGERVVIVEPRRRISYRVTGVRSYPKRIGLPAGIFARGGRSRLVLITCGGAFDAATGNYLDNVVAYAVPQR
jgi:hypothetical protein